jgi:hypothetical protein
MTQSRAGFRGLRREILVQKKMNLGCIVTALACSSTPGFIAGGKSSGGTVTLSRPAPVRAIVVNLPATTRQPESSQRDGARNRNVGQLLITRVRARP